MNAVRVVGGQAGVLGVVVVGADQAVVGQQGCQHYYAEF